MNETWTTLRGTRPKAKQKLLSAVCTFVQEVVEDNGLTERFKNWAKCWGEDEFDTCQLHHNTYNMLERHVMGITAPSLCGSLRKMTVKNYPKRRNQVGNE